MSQEILPLAVAVATITLGCAKPQPMDTRPAPVVTPITAPSAATAVAADDPDAICVAQCNASRKVKCTATNPQYPKEKFRTLAGPDKGIDECIKTCKADRAGRKHCLAEDTALRQQYIATVRCFPDGKIGSSECANATTDLMNCLMNQPRQ